MLARGISNQARRHLVEYLRHTLRARARDVFEQRFSAARFTAALADVYAELGFTP